LPSHLEECNHKTQILNLIRTYIYTPTLDHAHTFIHILKLCAPQSLLEQTESGSAKLTSELGAAEAMIASKSQELQAAELQLNSTREDLSKANTALAERESKVGQTVNPF